MDLYTAESGVKGYEMVYYHVTRYTTRKRDMSLLYTNWILKGEVRQRLAKAGKVKAKSRQS